MLASAYLGRVSFLCNLQHFCTRTSLKPRFRHVPPRGNTCCCSLSHCLRFFSDSSDFHRICFSSSSRAARNAQNLFPIVFEVTNFVVFSFPIGLAAPFSAAGLFWRPRFRQEAQPDPSKLSSAKKNMKTHLSMPREIPGAADRSWLRRPERNGI